MHSDNSMLLMLSHPSFQFFPLWAPHIVEQRQIIFALLFLNVCTKETMSVEKGLLLSLEYFFIPAILPGHLLSDLGKNIFMQTNVLRNTILIIFLDI